MSKHRIFFAIAILFVAFPPLYAWAEAGTADPGLRAIASTVQAEIDEGHIPGAVVIVGRQGHIVYRQAFGEKRIQPDRAPMTIDTIFDLASLTKVVATTTAIMQLVEAGRIRLADPVARYWPAFGENGKASITIEELLTHSGGLAPDLDARAPWSGAAAARARVAAEPPFYPAAARFFYSDLDFIALGTVVERVTGEPLDRYAARHIFAPLGMRDTGFRPSRALRARIAPTDIEGGSLRWGEVQDPTAHRMGGVAGHAGLFATADDLALFAQMLINGGSLNGRHILDAATVARMTAPHRLPGDVERGLGWDIRSPYGGGEDTAFGNGSYGHTGYSGTSLWIDPKRGTFLIILTSRLHPDGRGDVQPLRRNLAALVAAAIPPRVLTGIDVLEAENFAPLTGKQIGLLTNQTGRDAFGRRTIDILAERRDVQLVTIFSPEHGVNGDREGRIAAQIDSVTGRPIVSLYGAALHPSPAMLSQLDALVIDLQDVGVRFYTYATTMAYAMEAAAKAGVAVYVLDRPNPLTATAVKGPMLEPQRTSFTGYFPLPVQHGMTLGELAQMFNTENRIGAKLTVIGMQSYRRDLWYDETGVGWVDPSPNLRSPMEEVLYPGVGLIEGANISVGRGTSRPFELVGAPWIDGDALAKFLTARAIPGLRFAAYDFTPSDDAYAHTLCHGIEIIPSDRTKVNAPEFGIELASALHTLFPTEFELRRTLALIGSEQTLDEVEQGLDPRQIAMQWTPSLEAFERLRSHFLLYR